MWPLGVPLVLALSSATNANLIAWTVRVGSGSQDLARSLVRAPNGDVYVAYQTDGKAAVALVEPQDGVVRWTRILEPGDPTAAIVDPLGNLVVASNRVDGAGKPHAFLCSLAPNGALRWTVRGIGCPEVSTSRIRALSASPTGDSFFVGGSQDGSAAFAQHGWVSGARWRGGSTSGAEVVSLQGDNYASAGMGRAWTGSLLGTVAERPLSLTGHLAASIETVRLVSVRSLSASGRRLWAYGVYSELGHPSDAFAVALTDRHEALGAFTFDSGFADAPVDAATPWGSAKAGDELQVLVRRTESSGTARTTLWRPALNPFSGTQEPALQLPFNVTSLATASGPVFLARTGWDVALLAQPDPYAQILSFDAGLAADDHLAGSLLDGSKRFLTTTYRGGRSEVRLMQVQPVRIEDAVVKCGTAGSLRLTLGSPAPSQGYSFALSLSAGAPASLPAPSVRILPGERGADLPIVAGSTTQSTLVSVFATCQSQTFIGHVRVEPAKMTNLSLLPASVVGCVTARGSVDLDAPAPTGGLLVKLSSSRSEVDVPDQIVVAAGQRHAEFDACTFATSSDVVAEVVASAGGVTLRKALQVLRPSLSSVRFEPATVKGGLPACASLRISGPAPVGGLRFSATCTGAILSPGSLTIFANRDEQSFNLATKPVTRPTPSTLTVTANGRTMAATAIVVP